MKPDAAPNKHHDFKAVLITLLRKRDDFLPNHKDSCSFTVCKLTFLTGHLKENCVKI